MRTGMIAFALGVLALQLSPRLPDARLALLIPVLLWLIWRQPRLRTTAAFLCGALWALWRAHLVLADALPPMLAGRTVIVEGRVTGLPQRLDDAWGTVWRIQLDSEALRTPARRYPGCGRVLLYWRNAAQPVHTGERWRLAVRLKPPHGRLNPGGFDYETWLFLHRLRAVGRVLRHDADNRRLAAAGRSVDGLRAALRARLREAIGGYPHAGLVYALAIGSRDDVSAATRRTFRRTGTSHLLAISGLHIGLVAAFGFFAGRWLWSLPVRTLLWLPAQQFGALSSLVAAFTYAAMAGFSIPTQRALIMLAVLVADRLLLRQTRASDSLLLALLLVLLYDPLSVLAVGFWLSFAAVTILIYSGGSGVMPRSVWARVGKTHLVMAIGLAPVLMVWLGQNPVLGPLANLVAVPWVSFVAVPLVLSGVVALAVAPWLGFWLLQGALLALDLLWRLLDRLAGTDFAIWHHAATGVAPLVCAMAGVGLLLMPRGLPCRAMALIWMLPLLLIRPPRPTQGEVWFTLLDVGQGLSAVVRTARHTLVFDTGAAFGDSFDAGRAVVLPYLRREGVDRIDMLVVSHGDRDHIGGAASVLAGMETDDRLTSVPARLPASRPCADGQSWDWDGVAFAILNPPPGQRQVSSNNRSCVLRVVSAGGHAVLLTGDIEREAETRLVAAHRGELGADVLVAPHHGSKTSSSEAFVDAVRPDYVLYPTGYRNAYGFPHPQVTARYRRDHVSQWNTAATGAIEIRFGRRISTPAAYRRQHWHYWYDPMSEMP